MELRNYCLSKKAVSEETPFGPNTLVYKVAGKVFALAPLDEIDLSINLKCDPVRALELREKYEAIRPGFHMNKKHWNTLDIYKNEIPEVVIRELIDHSYTLVCQNLTRKIREQYNL